jgi:hypothetical protein
MEKVGTNKKQKKPSKKKQYERFEKTARELGIDDEKSAKAFETAFSRIIPSRPKSSK